MAIPYNVFVERQIATIHSTCATFLVPSSNLFQQQEIAFVLVLVAVPVAWAESKTNFVLVFLET